MGRAPWKDRHPAPLGGGMLKIVGSSYAVVGYLSSCWALVLDPSALADTKGSWLTFHGIICMIKGKGKECHAP